ncbi:PTB domain-containing engulfment adapter protein 1-like isoform X2 [Mercenaria mercenaria]|uniref:PTB domain-containing engulfment adapter protein 1-like isoform X2 n=1 Tax=Mercenaria mercenaria TaxID=6596 RepID=UPI00234F688A|nr:PTB domain-containing engulfment adapter protein 1-like isoform X2 [Mercenaria mercenaria]
MWISIAFCRQNAVLIPNEEFGRRKFINVGINRSLSLSRIEEINRNHTSEMRSGNKQWIHPPDAITRGHILYTVKFYGECEVDSPKGTDVVKDAIRKRKFNKTIWKTEGQKTPKVELSISVDGVTIQEPKTKIVKHQYPLHRISYCADDKSDKRMFSFIAKASDSSKHYCYVFASDKNAEEITLTIGQAFDLAYRKFLETQGKDVDLKKQQLVLQKKVETLERENEQLKLRIRELEMLKDRSDIENYKQSNKISDLSTVNPTTAGSATAGSVVTLQNMVGESSTDSPGTSQPSSPKLSSVGRKLENLMFEPSTPTHSNNLSNGTAHSPRTPGIISPPPPSTRSRTKSSPATPSTPPPVPQRNDINEDLASIFMNSTTPQQNNFTNNNDNMLNPFASPGGSGFGQDAFGMPTFTPDQKRAQGSGGQMSDKDFLDIQAGFSEGLTFGSADFGMDDFDPLNQSANSS